MNDHVTIINSIGGSFCGNNDLLCTVSLSSGGIDSFADTAGNIRGIDGDGSSVSKGIYSQCRTGINGDGFEILNCIGIVADTLNGEIDIASNFGCADCDFIIIDCIGLIKRNF